MALYREKHRELMRINHLFRLFNDDCSLEGMECVAKKIENLSDFYRFQFYIEENKKWNEIVEKRYKEVKDTKESVLGQGLKKIDEALSATKTKNKEGIYLKMIDKKIKQFQTKYKI